MLKYYFLYTFTQELDYYFFPVLEMPSPLMVTIL